MSPPQIIIIHHLSQEDSRGISCFERQNFCKNQIFPHIWMMFWGVMFLDHYWRNYLFRGPNIFKIVY